MDLALYWLHYQDDDKNAVVAAFTSVLAANPWHRPILEKLPNIVKPYLI